MQILIPMAGAGSRFQSEGFENPKPFITFCGKTMIENVIENLGYDNEFILVVQEEHYKKYSQVFDSIQFNIFQHGHKTLKLQLLNGITQGAADSCLKAINHINLNKPLMIANSDQMMEWDPTKFKAWFLDSGLDGAILTFDSQHPKNSYAEVNSQGFVIRTAEKEVISKYATNGIYVWRRARDFVDAAKEMILCNIQVNGEFYVAPTFNRNISWGQKIGIYPITNSYPIVGHHPIGTPSDLVAYLDYLIGKKNGNI